MATDNQFLSQLVPWFENLNKTQVHTKKLGNITSHSYTLSQKNCEKLLLALSCLCPRGSTLLVDGFF